MNVDVKYDKLWIILKEKGINKTQLCDYTGISTNSMARLGKNEPVLIDVLIRICIVLNCKIDDIVEYGEWGE